MNEIPTKKCRVCGGVFTYDKLVKNMDCIGGVESFCKHCDNERRRIQRQLQGEIYRKKCRDYRWKNHARIRENEKRYKNSHREEVRAAGREYWRLRPEKHRENSRRWRIHNREAAIQRTIRWQKKNPDKVNQYKHVSQQRRLAKKHSLPSTLSTKDWICCKSYFKNCCVYCGIKTKLTADHYVPLASPACLGTVANNILPACISCNSSKHRKNPVYWILDKFGHTKAMEILENIQSYFGSLETSV